MQLHLVGWLNTVQNLVRRDDIIALQQLVFVEDSGIDELLYQVHRPCYPCCLDKNRGRGRLAKIQQHARQGMLRRAAHAVARQRRYKFRQAFQPVAIDVLVGIFILNHARASKLWLAQKILQHARLARPERAIDEVERYQARLGALLIKGSVEAKFKVIIALSHGFSIA